MVKSFAYIRFPSVVFLTLLLLFSLGLSAQDTGDDYVEQHRKTAIILMKKSGIPASVIMGVSMIESAMGKSRNCKLLNNYFGVKGKNQLHKGKSGHRSAYKQYASALESFKDFVRMITTKKYYAALKGNMDYKKWLIQMNKHGYAEAKGKWIHDIESTIKKYDLTELDSAEIILDDDSYPIWGTDSTIMILQD